jgi:hypothetical protein
MELQAVNNRSVTPRSKERKYLMPHLALLRYFKAK